MTCSDGGGQLWGALLINVGGLMAAQLKADLCLRVVFTDPLLCFYLVLIKLPIRKWPELHC